MLPCQCLPGLPCQCLPGLPCQCLPGLPCQCLPGLGVLVVVPTQLFGGNELLQSRPFLGNDNDMFKVVVFHEVGLSNLNL